MKIEKPPYPRPITDDPLDARFWELCQTGRLHFQCCNGCGSWRFLPRYMCPKCGSAEYEWRAAKGRGQVFSWTVTYQAFHPAFAADVPYVAAVVELDEGVRMAARLLECPPDDVALDMPVELVFQDAGDGYKLPCFRPVRAG